MSFPFRVTDRFISLTPICGGCATLPSHAHVTGFDASDISGGTLDVSVEGYNGGAADFYMIVF